MIITTKGFKPIVSINIPVHSPTVTYRVKTFVVVALIDRPVAASMAPTMVTAQHP